MKILATFCRFPYPLDKGDKLRAFYQIKELSRRNEVFLFCFSFKKIQREELAILEQYCKKIHIEHLSLFSVALSLFRALFNSLPLEVAMFTNFGAKKNFRSFFKENTPEVSYFQFVRMGEYAKIIKGRKFLDFQDCLSVNMFRRMDNAGYFKKKLFLFEAKRLQRYEDSMFDVFDATSIITDSDRQLINSGRRNEISIIENGVSDSYLNYKGERTRVFDIIFSGNMSYSPNVMAAKFLVRDIMPEVWKEYPECKLVLAGASPAKEVRELASSKVVVTGWVEDMREYYAKSFLFVAPMQIGTGLQNKLLEAMAMFLPCITTSLANKALMAENGKEILVADTAVSLGQAIIRLLKDRTLYDSLSESGHKFVEDNYSWSNSVKKLEELFKK
ncbi:MAG: glycosyltransferase [Bacteroidales bacterium]|nr:glycosyltransferase [Bacteroidales bacterium]